jgi:hypothetical protein
LGLSGLLNHTQDIVVINYQGIEECKMTFEKELRELINKHNEEGASNTPDFILAQYLEACLAAFNTATQQRETWYGRNAAPSFAKLAEVPDRDHNI